MEKRPIIFMDGEFCKLTTRGVKFLSVALIAQNGKELYLEIEQPKEDIDPWVNEHVVPYLNGTAVTEATAKEMIISFVKENYKAEKPVLIADVNQFDWNGVCELFGVWNIPFFYIPIDFSSMLFSKGIDIDVDRETLAKEFGIDTSEFRKHNALSDTKVLAALWGKLGL